MQPKKIRWKMSLVPGVGAIFVALGAALAICRDDIFHYILENELKLSPSSKSYPVWKETPSPLYFDVYFFNWTNPDDILDPTTKPNVVEMGPYRFRETRKKVNITWHDNNSTVSYRLMRHWYFDAETSNGSLNDTITTLNVVAASAVYTTRFAGYLKQKGVSLGLAMFHEPIAITKTAGELLFDGYEDPLLDLARSLPNMDSNVPPVDKFGWFYERNGSLKNDGYFNMGTGKGDFSKFGKVINWNNASNTPFYSGQCSKVQGSAGEFYSTKLKKTNISMFSPDLCRTITFDFDEVVNVSGITGFKYSGGSSIMDNGTIHEENKCFCTGECQPSGALNVSTCRFGSPAFISFPHFYEADQFYTDAVTGLSPDKEKHNFYMTLEPVSGIPLDVAARFQLNILIAPSENVVLYNNVPRIFFPVLWFEQHVSLSKKHAREIKFLLKGPMIGHIVALVIFSIGVLLILWTPISVNIEACRWTKKIEKPVPETGKVLVLNNMRRLPKEGLNILPKVDEDDVESRDITEEEAVAEPLTRVNDLKKIKIISNK